MEEKDIAADSSKPASFGDDIKPSSTMVDRVFNDVNDLRPSFAVPSRVPLLALLISFCLSIYLSACDFSFIWRINFYDV